MLNFQMAFDAVAPLFCVILFGYYARRKGYLTEEEIDRINKWMFRLFLPILSMNNIYSSTMDMQSSMRLAAFCVIVTLIVWVLAVLFTLAVEKIPARRGVLIQAIYRSNMSVLAVPVIDSLYPNDMGEAMLVLAFLVPTFNVLAVLSLSIFCQDGIGLKRIAKITLTNPMILGCAAGLLFKTFQIQLPLFFEKFISSVGSSTTTMMLFVLGGYFSFRDMKGIKRDLIIGTVLRLLVVPGAAIGAAFKMGFRGAELCIVMASFAAPVAVASFAMSQQMGGDTKLCSALIVVSCAVSSVTLCFWIILLRSFGVML